MNSSRDETGVIELSPKIFNFTDMRGGEKVRIGGEIEIVADFVPLTLIKRSTVVVDPETDPPTSVEVIAERHVYGVTLKDGEYIPHGDVTNVFPDNPGLHKFYEEILKKAEGK